MSSLQTAYTGMFGYGVTVNDLMLDTYVCECQHTTTLLYTISVTAPHSNVTCSSTLNG